MGVGGGWLYIDEEDDLVFECAAVLCCAAQQTPPTHTHTTTPHNRPHPHVQAPCTLAVVWLRLAPSWVTLWRAAWQAARVC